MTHTDQVHSADLTPRERMLRKGWTPHPFEVHGSGDKWCIGVPKALYSPMPGGCTLGLTGWCSTGKHDNCSYGTAPRDHAPEDCDGQHNYRCPCPCHDLDDGVLL